jgi:thiamine-phosphate pyrophosphorylase
MQAKRKKMKGLYLVTPDWDDTQKMLDVTEAGLRGGAVLVQYRHKTASPALRQEQAARLLALCRRYQRLLIINDHIDLCTVLDADGVHVGDTDCRVEKVRAALGPSKIVGASCYGSLQLARDARDAGASYVAYGGFYPSRVKKYPVTTAIDIVSRSAADVGLPSVAIGGLTKENAVPLVAAGASMVAVISGVYMAADPEAAAREFAMLYPG